MTLEYSWGISKRLANCSLDAKIINREKPSIDSLSVDTGIYTTKTLERLMPSGAGTKRGRSKSPSKRGRSKSPSKPAIKKKKGGDVKWNRGVEDQDNLAEAQASFITHIAFPLEWVTAAGARVKKPKVFGKKRMNMGEWSEQYGVAMIQHLLFMTKIPRDMSPDRFATKNDKELVTSFNAYFTERSISSVPSVPSEQKWKDQMTYYYGALFTNEQYVSYFRKPRKLQIHAIDALRSLFYEEKRTTSGADSVTALHWKGQGLVASWFTEWYNAGGSVAGGITDDEENEIKIKYSQDNKMYNAVIFGEMDKADSDHKADAVWKFEGRTITASAKSFIGGMVSYISAVKTYNLGNLGVDDKRVVRYNEDTSVLDVNLFNLPDMPKFDQKTIDMVIDYKDEHGKPLVVHLSEQIKVEWQELQSTGEEIRTTVINYWPHILSFMEYLHLVRKNSNVNAKSQMSLYQYLPTTFIDEFKPRPQGVGWTKPGRMLWKVSHTLGGEAIQILGNIEQIFLAHDPNVIPSNIGVPWSMMQKYLAKMKRDGSSLTYSDHIALKKNYKLLGNIMKTVLAEAKWALEAQAKEATAKAVQERLDWKINVLTKAESRAMPLAIFQKTVFDKSMSGHVEEFSGTEFVTVDDDVAAFNQHPLTIAKLDEIRREKNVDRPTLRITKQQEDGVKSLLMWFKYFGTTKARSKLPCNSNLMWPPPSTDSGRYFTPINEWIFDSFDMKDMNVIRKSVDVLWDSLKISFRSHQRKCEFFRKGQLKTIAHAFDKDDITELPNIKSFYREENGVKVRLRQGYGFYFRDQAGSLMDSFTCRLKRPKYSETTAHMMDLSEDDTKDLMALSADETKDLKEKIKLEQDSLKEDAAEESPMCGCGDSTMVPPTGTLLRF